MKSEKAQLQTVLMRRKIRRHLLKPNWLHKELSEKLRRSKKKKERQIKEQLPSTACTYRDSVKEVKAQDALRPVRDVKNNNNRGVLAISETRGRTKEP